MSDEQNWGEIRIPEDEQEVIEMSGAETEQEKRIAIAQAKVIVDI